MSALLTATGLAAAHGARRVLWDVDFAISAGEIVTIVGPNGSGKSTLLRCLIGAHPPAAGRVERAEGLRLGYVPQRLDLDPTLPITVDRFLDLPRRHSGEDKAEALVRTGLPGFGTAPLAALSGGQRQRALLARALLGGPQILILDEPTQGLDQPGIAAFYRLVADLRDSMGCAILMVSHDLHVVMSRADRVICLNGHICCEGAPNVVTAAPAYRALFGAGTEGALALYPHAHDHHHHHDQLEAGE
ncbi:MAG: metal ABC transporter ATP-binding protein [Pseudomonadota bacterium]